MHDHKEHQPGRNKPGSFWKTPLGWAFIGFAAIAAFFLIAEHTAHLSGWLPWLLLLACPLMHIFGHGHGGHKHDKPDDGEKAPGNDGKSAHQR